MAAARKRGAQRVALRFENGQGTVCRHPGGPPPLGAPASRRQTGRKARQRTTPHRQAPPPRALPPRPRRSSTPPCCTCKKQHALVLHIMKNRHALALRMNDLPSVATGFASRTPTRSAAACGLEIANRDTTGQRSRRGRFPLPFAPPSHKHPSHQHRLHGSCRAWQQPEQSLRRRRRAPCRKPTNDWPPCARPSTRSTTPSSSSSAAARHWWARWRRPSARPARRKAFCAPAARPASCAAWPGATAAPCRHPPCCASGARCCAPCCRCRARFRSPSAAPRRRCGRRRAISTAPTPPCAATPTARPRWKPSPAARNGSPSWRPTTMPSSPGWRRRAEKRPASSGACPSPPCARKPGSGGRPSCSPATGARPAARTSRCWR